MHQYYCIDNKTIASYTVSRFRAGWTGVAALSQSNRSRPPAICASALSPCCCLS